MSTSSFLRWSAQHLLSLAGNGFFLCGKQFCACTRHETTTTKSHVARSFSTDRPTWQPIDRQTMKPYASNFAFVNAPGVGGGSGQLSPLGFSLCGGQRFASSGFLSGAEYMFRLKNAAAFSRDLAGAIEQNQSWKILSYSSQARENLPRYASISVI